MDIFSKRLRTIRQDAGLNQHDFGKAINCSKSVISCYENGREPSYETLVAIADYFGVSADYLLGLTNTRITGPNAKPLDTDSFFDAYKQYRYESVHAGIKPVSLDAIASLFAGITHYLRGNTPSGHLPPNVLPAFISGLTDLLHAINTDQPADAIESTNALLSSILDVTTITTTYLNDRGGRRHAQED